MRKGSGVRFVMGGALLLLVVLSCALTVQSLDFDHGEKSSEARGSRRTARGGDVHKHTHPLFKLGQTEEHRQSDKARDNVEEQGGVEKSVHTVDVDSGPGDHQEKLERVSRQGGAEEINHGRRGRRHRVGRHGGLRKTSNILSEENHGGHEERPQRSSRHGGSEKHHLGRHRGARKATQSLSNNIGEGGRQRRSSDGSRRHGGHGKTLRHGGSHRLNHHLGRRGGLKKQFSTRLVKSQRFVNRGLERMMRKGGSDDSRRNRGPAAKNEMLVAKEKGGGHDSLRKTISVAKNGGTRHSMRKTIQGGRRGGSHYSTGKTGRLSGRGGSQVTSPRHSARLAKNGGSHGSHGSLRKTMSMVKRNGPQKSPRTFRLANNGVSQGFLRKTNSKNGGFHHGPRRTSHLASSGVAHGFLRRTASIARKGGRPQSPRRTERPANSGGHHDLQRKLVSLTNIKLMVAKARAEMKGESHSHRRTRVPVAETDMLIRQFGQSHDSHKKRVPADKNELIEKKAQSQTNTEKDNESVIEEKDESQTNTAIDNELVVEEKEQSETETATEKELPVNGESQPQESHTHRKRHRMAKDDKLAGEKKRSHHTHRERVPAADMELTVEKKVKSQDGHRRGRVARKEVSTEKKDRLHNSHRKRASRVERESESLIAKAWPEEFTVNFTTNSGAATGIFAYDWTHKRQAIHHGPNSPYCSSFGTEDGCQMMETPNGTFVNIPSLQQCSLSPKNIGSLAPDWTIMSEYVGTEEFAGVGQCKGFAFHSMSQIYYETVDGGLPCAFVFPDSSLTYNFVPETFKVGADANYFDFPESCYSERTEETILKSSE